MRKIRNPHLVPSDRRIACQFYDQIGERPLSHKPATFVKPVAYPMSAADMRASTYKGASFTSADVKPKVYVKAIPRR